MAGRGAICGIASTERTEGLPTASLQASTNKAASATGRKWKRRIC